MTHTSRGGAPKHDGICSRNGVLPEGARGDDPRHRGARKAREEFGTQGPGGH
jgi:hypothetical protein